MRSSLFVKPLIVAAGVVLVVIGAKRRLNPAAAPQVLTRTAKDGRGTEAPEDDAVIPGQVVTFDLGRLPAGSLIQHRFMVMNPFNSPLRIKSVRTSCGCTAAGALPEELNGGKEAPLDIKVNTEGRSGLQEFAAAITFVNEPPGEVLLRANLTDRLPSEVDFGKVSREDCTSLTIEVRPAFDSETCTVAKLTFDNSYFSAKSNIAADGLPVIELGLVPNVRQGGFDKTVVVDLLLNGRERKQTDINVKGWVLEDVEAKDNSVDFGLIPDDRTIIRIMTLYSPYKKRLKVIGFESDVKGAVILSDCRLSPDASSCDVNLELNSKLVNDLQVIRGYAVVEVDGLVHRVAIDCYAGRLNP